MIERTAFWEPPRVVAAVVVALAAGTIAVLAVGTTWGLAPLLVLAAVSGPLVVIDAVQHRLPNRLVLPALAGVAVAVALAALLERDPAPLLGAGVGGGTLFAVYLALALFVPGAMGMGDVKLAALLGTALGALPWPAWPVGVVSGFLVGAATAVVAVLLRRATWRSHIPFGPAMIAGCWIAVALVGSSVPPALLP